MIFSKKALSLFIFIFAFSLSAPKTSAQIGIPHPFVDFSAIFVSFDPYCINGALVTILAPTPLVLLMPYVPITPITPVFKFWGPVPGASTLGNFLPGGVCVTKASGGIVSVPVIGTLVQIGTSAVPTPWFVPILIK
jgi:hypothetical protein